ncbi:MAG: hypothetical protein OXR66_04450 [Candidatus Woesearchaeota archaeon]|nr:hypothetical protein [Candidatus Woesearchaeota archaeon]
MRGIGTKREVLRMFPACLPRLDAVHVRNNGSSGTWIFFQHDTPDSRRNWDAHAAWSAQGQYTPGLFLASPCYGVDHIYDHCWPDVAKGTISPEAKILLAATFRSIDEYMLQLSSLERNDNESLQGTRREFVRNAAEQLAAQGYRILLGERLSNPTDPDMRLYGQVPLAWIPELRECATDGIFEHAGFAHRL